MLRKRAVLLGAGLAPLNAGRRRDANLRQGLCIDGRAQKKCKSATKPASKSPRSEIPPSKMEDFEKDDLIYKT